MKSKQGFQGMWLGSNAECPSCNSIACDVLIGRNPRPVSNPCYGGQDSFCRNWRCWNGTMPITNCKLGSFGARGDAVTVRPWKRSHFDRLAVCREKRAASPIQLLHNNDTHDGVDCLYNGTQPCEYTITRNREVVFAMVAIGEKTQWPRNCLFSCVEHLLIQGIVE
jgi:hypothetical protein